MTRRYKTNLRCAGCVTTIAPALDAAPGVKRWSADVESPDKVLTVEGDASAEQVGALIGKAGYAILGELPAEEPRPAPTPTPPVEEKTSYFPLALIVAYILGTVLLVEFAAGAFVWHRAMTNFMAGFFLVFSFFKLLDLRAFADTYQTYDFVAARSRAYALAYPFIELLGVAYHPLPAGADERGHARGDARGTAGCFAHCCARKIAARASRGLQPADVLCHAHGRRPHGAIAAVMLVV